MTIRSRDRLNAIKRFNATQSLDLTPQPIVDLRNHDDKPQLSHDWLIANAKRHLST